MASCRNDKYCDILQSADLPVGHQQAQHAKTLERRARQIRKSIGQAQSHSPRPRKELRQLAAYSASVDRQNFEGARDDEGAKRLAAIARAAESIAKQ